MFAGGVVPNNSGVLQEPNWERFGKRFPMSRTPQRSVLGILYEKVYDAQRSVRIVALLLFHTLQNDERWGICCINQWTQKEIVV